MRRAGAGLIAAVLALAGCKTAEPKPNDKDPAGIAAGRTKGKSPDWLATGPNAPKGGIDIGKEAQGLFGGRVIDPEGRGLKGVYIDVERTDAPPGTGAPVSILTKDDGYFLTQGLTPGVSYTLTARTQFEGKALVGIVQAKAPTPNITIQLRDDFAPPPGTSRPLPPSGALPPSIPPPSSELIPPVGVGPNPGAATGGLPKPVDGGWAPGVGPTSTAVPPTLPNAAAPQPKPAVPAPSSDAPVTRIRPESTANGPADPFKPPTASIPGPPVPPLPNSVPVIPPPNPDPEKKSARPLKPSANFALVDTLQRPWDFAAHRHGDLVLLDFMTTSCVPCKKSIPALADFQARFGASGLQLVGVVCDDAPLTERVDRAAKYQQANNLNYALYVEPGSEPGRVSNRFQVEKYPTAILLDGAGNVIWRGHPSADRAALESAIRSRLGK